MNWQGWVFLILAWTTVITLFAYCLGRILFGKTKLGR